MFSDRAIDDRTRGASILLGQLPHGHAGPDTGDPVHLLELAIDRRGWSLIGAVLGGRVDVKYGECRMAVGRRADPQCRRPGQRGEQRTARRLGEIDGDEHALEGQADGPGRDETGGDGESGDRESGPAKRMTTEGRTSLAMWSDHDDIGRHTMDDRSDHVAGG